MTNEPSTKPKTAAERKAALAKPIAAVVQAHQALVETLDALYRTGDGAAAEAILLEELGDKKRLEPHRLGALRVITDPRERAYAVQRIFNGAAMHIGGMSAEEVARTLLETLDAEAPRRLAGERAERLRAEAAEEARIQAARKAELERAEAWEKDQLARSLSEQAARGSESVARSRTQEARQRRADSLAKEDELIARFKEALGHLVGPDQTETTQGAHHQ